MKSNNKILKYFDDPVLIEFLEKEIAICNAHKVKIQAPNVDYVMLNGVACNGYFVDEPKPELYIAIKKPISEWLPVFIHESCHRDQWIEKSDMWELKIKKYFNSNDILDMWLSHAVELTEKQLQAVVKQTIMFELDCEKRAVVKIIENKLPIDVGIYVQKSNAYMFYHHILAQKRLYPTKSNPYEEEEVWKHMPKKFSSNYNTISKRFSDLLFKYCW